jgi:hypothetical protein
MRDCVFPDRPRRHRFGAGRSQVGSFANHSSASDLPQPAAASSPWAARLDEQRGRPQALRGPSRSRGLGRPRLLALAQFGFHDFESESVAPLSPTHLRTAATSTHLRTTGFGPECQATGPADRTHSSNRKETH